MAQASIVDLVVCCAVVALIVITVIARLAFRGPERRVLVYSMTRWAWAALAVISVAMVLLDGGKTAASWFGAVFSILEAALTQLIHFGLRRQVECLRSQRAIGQALPPAR